MAKIPFLIRKSFDIKTRTADKRIYLDLTAKRNVWYFVFLIVMTMQFIKDEIICGNGLVSTLDKNTPVKIIETDGSELVVVKRTDLATDDDKRKQLAVMDNSTSDSSDFDIDLLLEDFKADTLVDFGIYIPTEIDIEDIEEDEPMGVGKHLLKCPVCGHINEEKAFKNYENS